MNTRKSLGDSKKTKNTQGSSNLAKQAVFKEETMLRRYVDFIRFLIKEGNYEQAQSIKNRVCDLVADMQREIADGMNALEELKDELAALTAFSLLNDE